MKGKMKLPEAQAFGRKMMRLQDGDTLELETLYEMRRDIEEYFYSGFCGVGVAVHFRELIKESIYHQLKAIPHGETDS